MKNLENYGVQELNTRETESINGGVAPLLFIAIAAGLGGFWAWMKFRKNK